MQPDSFEDIIALVALYRPGPMDNILTYIACKKGEEEPDYMPNVAAHFGRNLWGAGLSRAGNANCADHVWLFAWEADLLRRAMGKKIKAEMDAQKTRFIDGAKANQVTEKAASQIFDQVEAFAGYGFNKSHAAAYALIAYQTAYLKANYPVAFLAGSMSLDYHNTDKLQVFVQDARA